MLMCSVLLTTELVIFNVSIYVTCLRTEDEIAMLLKVIRLRIRKDFGDFRKCVPLREFGTESEYGKKRGN
jgi:hypothetical protein